MFEQYSFIPFNIEDSDSDADELKEAKTALKNYMKETLSKVGTDEEVTLNTEYAKTLLPYIKKVMDLSPDFKAAVLEASQRRKVDLDQEAGRISDAIAYYIIKGIKNQYNNKLIKYFIYFHKEIIF